MKSLHYFSSQKSNFFKYPKIVALLCCMMYPLLNWAQIIPNYSKEDLIESYVETRREFFAFPDTSALESLSNMEKMNIRSKRTVQKISVYDNGRGQIREINYQEPPSVPGWMIAPQKVILSDEGIWSFDKDGKELAFTENTATTSKEQNQDVHLLEYYIRNFIPPGKADLQRLSIPDAAIEEVKAGVYKIKNADSETIWDTKKLVIHTETKDQVGKVKTERSKFFGKNKQGTIYPVKEMAKHNLQTRKDHKLYYRIEITDYSDYHIMVKGEVRSAQQTSLEEFMQPNLISTIVHDEITIGGAHRTEGVFQVKITDMTGRVILEREFDQPSRHLTIDLGNIQPGMYACMMRSEAQTITKKFVVQ